MSRFSTEGLPRPVIAQPLDIDAAIARRLGEFTDLMAAAGIPYDVDTLNTDPAAIAAQAAGTADTFFVAMLNDVARVTLLPSFAEGSDLDKQAQRAGLERLSGEQDAALRERMRLAWKGKSAAGPDDYYKSACRNYSPLVKDVAVTAETRNFSDRVLILWVLTTDNGGALSDSLRAELTSVLNVLSFRSRNVTVEVRPAVLTTKALSANIYLYPDAPETVIDLGRDALTKAYMADQRLGFDLTRSYVEKYLHQPGVQRVELQGWSNTFAAPNEAIRLGAMSLTPLRLDQ